MSKNIFNSFFGMPDDNATEDYDNTNQIVNSNPRKVLSMTENRVPDSKINIMEPRIYADAKSIARKLLDGNAVLIKMENVQPVTIRRIVDYISGTIFSIDGSIQQIDEHVYLCAPKSFAIDGDVKKRFNKRLETNNDYSN
ncbi:cell division protein SepF [Fructilactobacillus sp. Tb1]|uniref:cell division protein SepF n=1 Tax=Fructilactobacillus sp. Tb1 TaxID=3422304 RepID=UPI003D268785